MRRYGKEGEKYNSRDVTGCNCHFAHEKPIDLSFWLVQNLSFTHFVNQARLKEGSSPRRVAWGDPTRGNDI